MKLKGILKQSNTPDKNGNLYSKECLRDLSLKLGELNHPETEIKITDVSISDDNLFCEVEVSEQLQDRIIEILNSPHSYVARGFVNINSSTNEILDIDITSWDFTCK